jgi:hypothetical protein
MRITGEKSMVTVAADHCAEHADIFPCQWKGLNSEKFFQYPLRLFIQFQTEKQELHQKHSVLQREEKCL